MSNIIRSPSISEEKRKLSTRRKQKESQSVDPAVSEAEIVAEQNKTKLNSLVEQARQAVLSQFKEEAEAARELGRQRGLREGRLAGIEEAKQSFANEIARVKSIADNLPEAIKTGIAGMEDMLVEIAFEAVCKILGDPAVSREAIQSMVRQATARTQSGEKVLVRLHASDLELLRKMGVLPNELPTGATLSWVADANVALGGCVIEAEGGELDARLETQMQRLRDALLTARQSG